MIDFIPTLNSTGVFSFKKPVSDNVNPQTVFTTKSVRKITELLSANVDVFNEYYVPLNIDSESYVEDKANDVSIVGLYSDTDNWLYVPSSYLLSYPDLSGVPYRRTAITINLGPLEETYDLGTINTLLSDIVKTHIGIDPDIRAVYISEKAMIKRQDHEAILRTRNSKIDVNKTMFLELINLRKQVIELSSKNKILEDHILRITNN